MGPLFVSLDSPFVTQPDGTLQIDRLGTGNVAPLVVVTNGTRQINPALAANGIRVMADQPSEILVWEMHATLGG